MQKQKFIITINARRQKVWETLFNDETFRDWANLVDEGTYMKGELKEGGNVEFISSVGGYGVRSLVVKLIPNEFVLFHHGADTKDEGEKERDKEWTGGTESYSLTELEGVTTLTLTTDIPPTQEKIMNERLPIALKRIKTLAEQKIDF